MSRAAHVTCLAPQNPLRSGRCLAQVRFTPRRPRASVNVSCRRLLGREQRQQEDLQLFRLLKDLPMPLANTSIPGKIPCPRMLGLWGAGGTLH